MKAIFLDRDGTINVDYGYVYKSEDLHLIDGVIESLKRLQDAGFLLIIITNQSGVGRGYFSESDAEKFNQLLIEKLKKSDIIISDVYMCIHTPENHCNCRKPFPYMINKALEKYQIDASKSYMLGDKQSDVESGLAARVESYLIDNNHDIGYWTDVILKKNK